MNENQIYTEYMKKYGDKKQYVGDGRPSGSESMPEWWPKEYFRVWRDIYKKESKPVPVGTFVKDPVTGNIFWYNDRGPMRAWINPDTGLPETKFSVENMKSANDPEIKRAVDAWNSGYDYKATYSPEIQRVLDSVRLGQEVVPEWARKKILEDANKPKEYNYKLPWKPELKDMPKGQQQAGPSKSFPIERPDFGIPQIPKQPVGSPVPPRYSPPGTKGGSRELFKFY